MDDDDHDTIALPISWAEEIEMLLRKVTSLTPEALAQMQREGLPEATQTFADVLEGLLEKHRERGY